jgi:hypothetical protein
MTGSTTKYRALHLRRRNGFLQRGSTLCLAQHTNHQNLAYSQDSWQPQLMAIFFDPGTVTYAPKGVSDGAIEQGGSLPERCGQVPRRRSAGIEVQPAERRG